MPGSPCGLAFLEAVPEIAVGQLHDDEQLAFDDIVPFQREDVRMANRLDAVERLELLLGGRTPSARLPSRSP